MDKLETYRNYVIKIIDKYGSYRPACGDIEIQKVCDEKNDHYQVINVGWHGNRRVYGCSLHLDIKNNKIWIQHNGTDRSIADELTELGVRKEDIVLGFHTPYMRQFTDYATNIGAHTPYMRQFTDYATNIGVNHEMERTKKATVPE